MKKNKMKQDQQQDEKPQWQFNLRRISTSRAEILDLNKASNNNNNSTTKKKSVSMFSNCDDYIKMDKSKLSSEQPSETNKLVPINLMNMPLLELSYSNLKSNDGNLSENSNRKSEDEGKENYEQLLRNDFQFDVNLSLIDQINSIKNKLDKIKSSVVLEPNSKKTSKSKIELNIAKATAKASKTNASLTQEPKPMNQTLISIPVSNQRKICQECIFERLDRLGANAVSNDSFQHVLTEIKASKFMHTQSNNMATPYLKCEFIYGDRLYWCVKIKRYFRNLFQIKFLKDTGINANITNSISMPSLSSAPILSLQVPTFQKKNDFENNLHNLESCKNDFLVNDPNSISPNSSISSSQSERTDNKIAKSVSHTDDNQFFSIDSKEPKFIKNLRPIGWSKNNGYLLQKPNVSYLVDSTEHHDNDFNSIEIKEFFTHYSSNLNSFCVGSYYELENWESNNVDLVKIINNIAGRLLIEHADMSQEWLFYLDTRLNPLGWAKKNKLEYSEKSKYLKSIVSEEEKKKCENLKNELGLNLQTNQHELRHERQQYFKLNHYVECLYSNKFYVARVCEVQNEIYFKVKLSSKNVLINGKVLKFYLTSNVLSTLFPCKWCAKFNLVLEPPNEWNTTKAFDWDEYIAGLNGEHKESIYSMTIDLSVFNWLRSLNNLSEKFQVGSYLECVDSKKYSKIENDLVCLAQIKAKLAHLIFVKLINSNSQEDKDENSLRVFSVDSMSLFPVGWCEMNNYYGSYDRYIRHYHFPIKFKDSVIKNRIIENIKNATNSNLTYFLQFKDEENWCEKVYLNMNCNSGPYLNKAKLSALPKSFGPGPIVLVISKIIQMLVNISDKPFKLIKHLQSSRRTLVSNTIQNNDIPNFNNLKSMQKVRIKAKEKGKYLFKDIEICTQFSRLSEFINDLCHRLKCCNQMISFSEKINKPKSTDRICVDLKCCIYCTINYFSSLISGSDYNQNVKNSSKLNASTNHNGTQNIKKNQSLTVKHNKSSSRLDSLIDMPNHSPIKTRLNVRQTFLQQEEYERIQLLREQEKLEKNPDIEVLEIDSATNNNKKNERRIKLDKGHKNHKSNNNGEPSIKKSRKSKNSEDQSSENSAEMTLDYSSKTSENDLSLLNQSASTTSMKVSPRTSSAVNGNNYHANQSFNNLVPISSPTPNLLTGSNISSSNNSFNSPNHSTSMNASDLKIESNPIYWQISDVCKYLAENKFEPHLIYLIKEHEIDGQSFLMLNLPTIQNYMKLKLGPAIKLAHLVEKLKQIHFKQFKSFE